MIRPQISMYVISGAVCTVGMDMSYEYASHSKYFIHDKKCDFTECTRFFQENKIFLNYSFNLI